MARGKTLISLLNDLRAECKLSLNPAHNIQVRDTHVMHLQRVQEWLWDDFNWPHLRVDRDQSLQAGQRYYQPPSDIPIDRITHMFVRDGGRWVPLIPSIDRTDLNQYDSDLDQRGWPVLKWRFHEDEQIEVWPIPDQNGDSTTLEGQLRVRGIRNLRPLVNDSDVADLDSRLIVLYAAAEIQAAAGSKDAQLKLANANKMYGKLRGNMVPRKKFKMFGTGGDGRRIMRGPPTVYWRTGS